jgi:transposase
MGRFNMVVAMAEELMEPQIIAQTLGVSIETVYNYTSKARSEGRDIPRCKTRNRRLVVKRITISEELMGRLRDFGARRGLTESEVATRILEAAVFDKIVGAILDDGVRDD